MRIQNQRFDRKSAESLAISALQFLADAPERLGRFLALTGVSPGEIRRVAAEPAFLAAVLEHVAGDEALLVEFAAVADCDPRRIDEARTLLAGADWERDTP